MIVKYSFCANLFLGAFGIPSPTRGLTLPRAGMHFDGPFLFVIYPLTPPLFRHCKDPDVSHSFIYNSNNKILFVLHRWHISCYMNGTFSYFYLASGYFKQFEYIITIKRHRNKCTKVLKYS